MQPSDKKEELRLAGLKRVSVSLQSGRHIDSFCIAARHLPCVSDMHQHAAHCHVWTLLSRSAFAQLEQFKQKKAAQGGKHRAAAQQVGPYFWLCKQTQHASLFPGK
jgi:hypothetical protein